MTVKPGSTHTFSAIRHYRGIQSRVARNLGVSKTMVSHVVNGKKTSARISAALDAEIELVNKAALDRRADPPIEPKPRIRFRVWFGYPNGEVMATGNFPFCGATVIGRAHVEAGS
jgi:hypothetical protein